MHEARERTRYRYTGTVLYRVPFSTGTVPGTVQNSTGSVTTVPITGVPCPLCPLWVPAPQGVFLPVPVCTPTDEAACARGLES